MAVPSIAHVLSQTNADTDTEIQTYRHTHTQLQHIHRQTQTQTDTDIQTQTYRDTHTHTHTHMPRASRTLSLRFVLLVLLNTHAPWLTCSRLRLVAVSGWVSGSRGAVEAPSSSVRTQAAAQAAVTLWVVSGYGWIWVWVGGQVGRFRWLGLGCAGCVTSKRNTRVRHVLSGFADTVLAERRQCDALPYRLFPGLFLGLFPGVFPAARLLSCRPRLHPATLTPCCSRPPAPTRPCRPRTATAAPSSSRSRPA